MTIRIVKCENGTTAIEFALILPVLVLIIMGAIEISLFLFVQSSMEGATFAVSRLGKTGFIEDGLTREETIRAELDERLGVFLDPEELVITSQSYDDFTSVGAPEPFIDVNGNGTRDDGENYTDTNGNGQYDEDMGVDGAGDSGDVVMYTVTYPWHVMTPMFQDHLGEEGVVEISSRFIVKNEPYNDD
jgi:hypothetical protein